MKLSLPVSLVYFLLNALSAVAHPGIGIVQDSRGNLYYTDLENVWKVTPSGQKQLAVRNVHTHELFIDRQDNLYGEHSWYEGEATNKWGHYVWRLTSAGQLTKVIPNTEGFLTNYSFVRDQAGSMYWVEHGTPCRFMKKQPNGSIRQLATGVFSDVRWQYATADGQLYFVNDDDLHQLSPDGTFTLIKSNLDETLVPSSGHNHNLRGIWSDKRGCIYIAVSNKDKVQKISPDGQMTTVATSPSPWSPSGGLIAANGVLWLLEYNTRNEARIRAVR